MNPPFIPRWSGTAPIWYWVEPALDALKVEVVLGITTWARELRDIRVLETQFPGGPRTIRVRLQPLVGVLGLAFYPPELIKEPEAGDIILNSNVDWLAPENRKLFLPLCIHEAGHAFGMGHAYTPSSVMFPNIEAGKVNLSKVDRWMFRALYNGEITPHPGD